MIRYGHGATLLGAAAMAVDGRNGLVPVVMTPEDVSTRDGRAYIAATPHVDVTNGNYLHCKLTNPANSGHNLMVTVRRFTNTGANVLGYRAFSNPTATPGLSGVIPNRLLGGPVTAATFTYEQNVNGTFLGGASGSIEAIPANGFVAVRAVLVIMPPDTSLGFTVTGDGGPINGGKVTAVIEYYEEDILSAWRRMSSPQWGLGGPPAWARSRLQ